MAKMSFLLDYEKRYWDEFMKWLDNEYGVAGLMGNLKAESGLLPYRKQGDMKSPYVASQEYTNNVDNGAISRASFISDEIGYGLAQWTFHTRKAALYDMKGTRSIGDFDLSVEFLKHEMETSYPSVYQTLRSTDSIKTASDKVLHEFESPADQSESVEQARYSLGYQIWEKYHGQKPDPGPGPGPTPGTGKKKMPVWMMLKRI